MEGGIQRVVHAGEELVNGPGSTELIRIWESGRSIMEADRELFIPQKSFDDRFALVAFGTRPIVTRRHDCSYGDGDASAEIPIAHLLAFVGWNICVKAGLIPLAFFFQFR